MTTRTCPDWPTLMEVAPELQFKHYSLREVQLPADALVSLESVVDFDTVTICCDLDHHVLNPDHTDPAAADALRSSHWFSLAEWAARGPGSEQS